MRLVDSNIIIYAARPEYLNLKELLEEDDIAVSELTKLEVLGYRHLTPEAEEYFNAVFELVTVLPISNAVVNRAIVLRQQANMKAADSVIAATALLHCTEIITRNVDDFNHINDLIVNNPLN